ncbi:MAG TPA: PKD domain-containing protein, partial [Chitinophagaceae bacterium]|nr:PKD domain-containing protein [Chitinophagaceae bacterium]
AFAGRGMGFNAIQGSANLVGDEVESFLMPPFCLPATQAPIAAFSSDSISIGCGVALHFTDQSLNAFDWHWNFGDLTTSTLQNPTHTFTSPGVYTVKLIVSNPLGIDSITHNITVNPAFTVSVNASPTSICGGASVNMNAVATGSNNKSYLVNSIPYSPISFTGNSVSLTDDQMSGANPIGFPFIFYGQSYTSFYICSNGFITFSSGAPASVVYGPPIPSSPLPNNLIALAWNDLNPLNAGSQIKYTTLGVAPNRKLIVDYNTSHFLSTSLPYQVQAILYEGSNEIEIHSSIISDASSFDGGATTTQGIENQNGSAAITISARNSSFFTANNDAYRFTPTIPYSYTWIPGNLNGSTQTVNPLLTTSYTVSVTDGTACTVNYNLPVITVNPCAINLNLKLFIEGYYNGGGSMQPVLYNEGVSLNQTLCDSITVELRSAIAPYNLVASSNALLQVNGQANCPFLILSGQYYIVVKHRNGLQTWSANPITIATGASGIVNYDFTISLNQAYGQNMKEVEAGVWAIYSGDIMSDENIDLIDYQALETSIYNFGFGYIATDINGDGNVDLLDTSTVEENINTFIFSSHP